MVSTRGRSPRPALLMGRPCPEVLVLLRHHLANCHGRHYPYLFRPAKHGIPWKDGINLMKAHVVDCQCSHSESWCHLTEQPHTPVPSSLSSLPRCLPGLLPRAALLWVVVSFTWKVAVMPDLLMHSGRTFLATTSIQLSLQLQPWLVRETQCN